MKRHLIKPGNTFNKNGVWELYPDCKKPVMSCPTCGGLNLGDDATHRIEDNGDVNASVICAHGCGFHKFVTLEGWKCEKGLRSKNAAVPCVNRTKWDGKRDGTQKSRNG